MALIRTPAIILSSMRLGEADKLITFYTLRQGRISGVARNARQIKNRFGAALEPFTYGQMIFFEKSGSALSRIQQADILCPFENLKKSWEGIRGAAQLCYWIRKMTPEAEPNRLIFRLLLEGLTFLENQAETMLSKMIFIIHLVAACGYQPNLSRCMKCRCAFAAHNIFFSPSDGGGLCAFCAPHGLPSLSPDTRAYVQQVSALNYRLAHRFKPSPRITQETRLMMAAHLAYLQGTTSRVQRHSAPNT